MGVSAFWSLVLEPVLSVRARGKQCPTVGSAAERRQGPEPAQRMVTCIQAQRERGKCLPLLETA